MAASQRRHLHPKQPLSIFGWPPRSGGIYTQNNLYPYIVTLEVSPGAEKWFNTRSRLKAGSRTLFVFTSRQQKFPALCPTILRQGAKAFSSGF
jgi:hypothetical protein